MCSAVYLMVVEDEVSIDVLSRHSVGPQLFHEEHLVGKLGGSACTPTTHPHQAGKQVYNLWAIAHYDPNTQKVQIEADFHWTTQNTHKCLV